jgi:hypothetical protein
MLQSTTLVWLLFLHLYTFIHAYIHTRKYAWCNIEKTSFSSSSSKCSNQQHLSGFSFYTYTYIHTYAYTYIHTRKHLYCNTEQTSFSSSWSKCSKQCLCGFSFSSDFLQHILVCIYVCMWVCVFVCVCLNDLNNACGASLYRIIFSSTSWWVTCMFVREMCVYVWVCVCMYMSEWWKQYLRSFSFSSDFLQHILVCMYVYP